jgi:hypothetical protein
LHEGKIAFKEGIFYAARRELGQLLFIEESTVKESVLPWLQAATVSHTVAQPKGAFVKDHALSGVGSKQARAVKIGKVEQGKKLGSGADADGAFDHAAHHGFHP